MEYNDAYSKTSGSLWQYNRDEPALDNNGNIADYNNNNFLIITIIVLHSILNKKKTGQTGNGGTIDPEIVVPLRYLSNFRRTLEMPLINSEISLQLKQSRNCIVVAGTTNNQNPTFRINDFKLYAPFVTLSTQENIKFLKHLESGL